MFLVMFVCLSVCVSVFVSVQAASHRNFIFGMGNVTISRPSSSIKVIAEGQAQVQKIIIVYRMEFYETK